MQGVPIVHAAKTAGAVVMTRDADFIVLLDRFGPPPQVVWLRSGNTSNANLRDVLNRRWAATAAFLESGEALVEIRG